MSRQVEKVEIHIEATASRLMGNQMVCGRVVVELTRNDRERNDSLIGA